MIKNYINGNQTCVSSNTLNITDPSTGEITSKVVLSNKEDYLKTINSSKKGYDEWSRFTPLKRSRVISKYKELKIFVPQSRYVGMPLN